MSRFSDFIYRAAMFTGKALFVFLIVSMIAGAIVGLVK